MQQSRQLQASPLGSKGFPNLPSDRTCPKPKPEPKTLNGKVKSKSLMLKPFEKSLERHVKLPSPIASSRLCCKVEMRILM